MLRGIPAYVRALALPLVAALVVYLVHAVTRFGGTSADTFFGTDVYQAIKALGLLLIALRVITRRGDRVAFALLAAGFALNLAGDVAWGVLYRDAPGEVPVPSLSDVLYVVSYLPFSAAAILLMRRARTRGPGSGGLWLDGVVVALTLTTAVAYQVLPPLLAAWHGATAAAIATNAAYPIGDALVTAALVASIALRGWRLDARSGLLALTFAMWVLADAIYIVQVARNTYVPAGVLDLGWLGSSALAALSAWVRAPEETRDGPTALSSLIPSCAGSAAIALLLIDDIVADTPWLIFPVSLVALLIFARFTLVSHDNHRLIRHNRREAITDALTGLANRRRLLEDLEQAVERERTLVLFDLDGFKAYNDTFGHPAGDAMLQLVARALVRELGSDGVAYRLGGDEFCALATGASDPQVLGRRLADAMEQEGPDYWIGASFGAAVVPAEEAAGGLVLAHADGLLYADKRARHAARAASA
jgi:diguanylate cyclase (GGDEF)-like protein